MTISYSIAVSCQDKGAALDFCHCWQGVNRVVCMDNAGAPYSKVRLEQNATLLEIDTTQGVGGMHPTLQPATSKPATSKPVTSKKYDLTVIFSECIAVNDSYHIGDLVLLDCDNLTEGVTHYSALSTISHDFPSPENDPNIQTTAKIIALLKEGPKSAQEIKSVCSAQGEDWSSHILPNVFKPNQGYLWEFYESKWQLTTTGQEIDLLHRPKIHHTANIDCSQTYIERDFTTNPPRFEVIDQVSDTVFAEIKRQKLQNPNSKFLFVSRVCDTAGNANMDKNFSASFTREVFGHFLVKAANLLLK